MPTARTPSQLLAEVLLGRPLDEYVAEKRTSRPVWPWQLIAEQLADDTDGKVNLSAEWLRRCYLADRAEASS